jgi:hypothetical protein
MARPFVSLALVSFLVSSGLACDKPGETEQKKEAYAAQQAQSAQVQALQTTQAAVAQADTKIAEARADFEKTREDYLHGRRQDLLDLDQKIGKLETKSVTATGATRATLDLNLPAIRAKRAAVANDLQQLGTVAPSLWDGAKAGLDKDWQDLKAAVDQAS